MKMSQRLRQSALNSLLSKFAKNKAIILVDKISTIEPKTKTALNFISKLEKDNQSLASAKKFAIITSRSHKSVKRAFGNLKRVNLLSVKSLNSYLLANNKYLILTEASVKKLRK